MGMTEAGIFSQLKKGQGETNQRLEALIAEQRTTNELLAQIVRLLEQQQAARPTAQYQADSPMTRSAGQQPYPQLGRR